MREESKSNEAETGAAVVGCKRQQAVERFHERIAAQAPTLLALRPADQSHFQDLRATDDLRAMAHELAIMARGSLATASDLSDNRLFRAHLQLEELSEMLEALADRDEVALLDALADTEYVTHGVAVSFMLPLDAAFWEVHRSNMTKRSNAQADGIGQDRIDGDCAKDAPGYSPADIAGVLSFYRRHTPSSSRGAMYERDGDKWCAKRADFVDLATSLTGFGDTKAAALVDLERQESEASGA